MQDLIRQEHRKAHGIINGIDTEVWNPMTDIMLNDHYSRENFEEGKRKNKNGFLEEYGLNPELPLFAFIGRFAWRKGADMLPDIVRRSISETEGTLNILILGSGNPQIENTLKTTSKRNFISILRWI